jgi:hypothetical protein
MYFALSYTEKVRLNEVRLWKFDILLPAQRLFHITIYLEINNEKLKVSYLRKYERKIN